MWRIRFFYIGWLVLAAGGWNAQTTRDSETAGSSDKKANKGGHKVMLIPFEPKLYMSEIDKKVGEPRKMNFEQVRTVFRAGLDRKVAASLGSVYSTYSLLADSVHAFKDLHKVYQGISYQYELTPGSLDQKAEKKKTAVEKGMLEVDTDSRKRFMLTQIIDPSLLAYLNKKYGTDLFVFISELDIRNDPESYDAVTDTYQRRVGIHYTAFDKTGKQLSADLVVVSFPSNINDPKQIIDTYFAYAARTIRSQITNALTVSKPAAGAVKQ